MLHYVLHIRRGDRNPEESQVKSIKITYEKSTKSIYPERTLFTIPVKIKGFLTQKYPPFISTKSRNLGLFILK
jgi:hypothetical protein